MATATLERPLFPKTVTACHAEIVRLRVAIENHEDDDSVVTLKKDAIELNSRIDALETENKEMKEAGAEDEQEMRRLIERNSELEDAARAIDSFLYEVERPAGCSFKFDVIHGPAADRAILSMFDAVGRQP